MRRRSLAGDFHFGNSEAPVTRLFDDSNDDCWSRADSAGKNGAGAAGGPGAEPSEGIGCQLGEELEDADHEAGSAVHFKGSERAEHRAACTV